MKFAPAIFCLLQCLPTEASAPDCAERSEWDSMVLQLNHSEILESLANLTQS